MSSETMEFLPLRRNSSQRSMAIANYFRKLGYGHILLGCLAVSLQIAVTVMACLYYGLYAWNWDAPTLAKSSMGICSGTVAIILGALQIDAGAILRKSSRANVDDRFCAIKMLNCLSALFALLVLGISVYLLYILMQWLNVEDEMYRRFQNGPVAVGVVLNSAQGLVAVLEVVLSILGVAMRDF
ncbi:uncharacterized protein LOC129595371 [Paramacrobiotus metropolitanus]|uniref:uncharacterized protein LOC129595371 n=1 Tax=Paramacrobiotus metropolitanus TaxID=2943436 RepID=UPI0024463AEF|nr:uncharacterized protein LOC129595371 [Paramacrobiotus metropolitanus]